MEKRQIDSPVQLARRLQELQLEVEPVFDGSFVRTGAHFFQGFAFMEDDNEILWAQFGDWSRKLSDTWCSADTLSPAIQAKAQAKLAEIQIELRAAKKKLNLEVAEEAEKFWAAGQEGSHPYIETKKLSKPHGTRVYINGHPVLLVPMRDIEGKLWNVTRVYTTSFVDEKTGKERGNKFLLKGGRKEGLFHAIGELTPTGRYVLCEGFATGASLKEALNPDTTVIVCFDCDNLVEVAKVFKKKYPNAAYVVGADNDQWKPEKGNPGLDAGHDACVILSCPFVAPKFKETSTWPTDWNDLHVQEGLEEVARQFRAPDAPKDSGELTALPGKLTKAKHQLAASALAKLYGDRIIKQDRDIFLFTGTHWKSAGTLETDLFRRQLQLLLGGGGSAGEVDSAYRLFGTGLPHVPDGVNLFTPPPWLANFRNGTLHVVKKDRKYVTEFRPHTPSDWAINVLPYEYKPGDTATNAEFMRMLDRVFEGDSDKDEKIRALRQMYGACLIPAFPHLFMLHGVPGTGKSTAIILASRLVHADNSCSVDPTEFDSFNLETMAGKLVNWDTDIEMHKPISEKQIKKIIDRLPFRIRRKGVKDIYAPIPAVHIFGGNDIPKTLDGASRAHDRRWTFIGFDRVIAKGTEYDVDYASFCFSEGPEGILNFALAGLRDLLDSAGHFMVPKSGREKMEDWQLRTDPLGQFLRDLDQGQVLDSNVQLKRGSGYRIKQSQLWTVFAAWHLEVHRVEPKITRFSFYAALRARGYQTVAIKGFDHFAGLGTVEVESSQF